MNRQLYFVCLFVCLFVIDTSLSSDVALFNHLHARTPVSDVPLNWPSDDSDTERLISAAETLLSTRASDVPCWVVMPTEANETSLLEVQTHDEMGVAEASVSEPLLIKSPVEETASAEPFFGNSLVAESAEEQEGDRVGHDEPGIHLSCSDLVLDNFHGQRAFRLTQSVLDSFLNTPHHAVRQRAEPTHSAESADEPTKLEHQASAPANLEEAAISENNVSDTTTIHKAPVKPEVPSTCHATLSVPKTMSSVSPDPNQVGLEVIGFPLESAISPPSGSVMSQQLAGAFQGARSKFPPTTAPETSLIPLFVEQEILSEDDEDVADMVRKKYDETSSSDVLGVNQFLPQVMSGNVIGPADNVTSQLPAADTRNRTSEQLAASDVGILPELDLRNNDESVSASN